MTLAMRTLASLLVVCALAVPALAQPDPDDAVAARPASKTLERAIKLYDKKDFYSASIELSKVTSGESGDDAENQRRAQFFQAKTYFQMGFYGASLAHAAAIARDPQHRYFAAISKWLLALTRVAPSPSLRAVLFGYRGHPVIDDPMLASVRDEFAYQLGREMGMRDVPAGEAIAMLSQVTPAAPEAVRAQLEIARIMLRTNDLDGGIARAMSVARTPEHAAEATRLIASWTHLHAAPHKARAPLAELARTNAYARYQHSRAMLDGRPELPGLERVPIEVFDAVMLPSACRGRMPDDVKPLARQVLEEAKPLATKLLAFEDNAELFDAVRRLQQSAPTPGGDVVLAVLSDREMREQLAWFDELGNEVGLVQRSDRAWQTTPAAADVLQELTVQQSLAAADVGALARTRISQLATGLVGLDEMLRGASPGFALSAGPEGLLHVEPELCRGGGTQPVVAASQVAKPRSGCAGCATTGPGWSVLVLLGLTTLLKRRAAAR